MEYPGYAALYVHFGEIQLLCDIAVVQTLSQQAIDGSKDSGLFLKASAFRASYLKLKFGDWLAQRI